MNASSGVVRDDKQKPDHDGGLEAASVGGPFISRAMEKRPQQRGLGADVGPPIPTAGYADTSGRRSRQITATWLIVPN